MKKTILTITQSKTNYYLSLIADAATAALFLILGLTHSTDMMATFALFIIGALFFTFLEYAVHAWFFHIHHPLKIFIEGHAHHHKDPFSYDAMPFFMSFVIASVFAWFFSLFMSGADALGIVGGLVLGYFNYGIVHHIMHRTEFQEGGYWRYMQEFHFSHHKKPKMNHGVTTDIWDRVFGTYSSWEASDLKGMNLLKKANRFSDMFH